MHFGNLSGLLALIRLPRLLGILLDFKYWSFSFCDTCLVYYSQCLKIFLQNIQTLSQQKSFSVVPTKNSKLLCVDNFSIFLLDVL